MNTTLLSGTTLQNGKYTIVKSLGQGSFGITYLATTTLTIMGKLGQMDTTVNVAIKEFFMRDVNQRDRNGSITGMTEGSLAYNYAQKFRKEAERLATMNHPNIVKVMDFVEANNTFYYVMDFIDGEDISHYMNNKPLQEDEAISIIKDVANALQYMHEEHKMLHLDLKPGNIMRRRSDGHIFLIDFGLSKHYSDEGQPDTSTTIGLGTEGYAPLEQGKRTTNRNDFLPTIDIYALGATLFKILTGSTPPAATDVLADEDIIPSELKKGNISDTIIDIVVKSMQPSAKKRTPTVRDFISALDQTLYSSKQNGRRTSSSTSILAAQILAPQIQNDEETIIEGSFITNKPKYYIKQYLDKCEVRIDGTDYSFRKVKAGTFLMGDCCNAISQITHEVTLTNDYYLSTVPITQKLWIFVMGYNNSINKGTYLPVENVSWYECHNFIEKLTKITGLRFRLPTEAEWEFAAKGGHRSKGFCFSGSDKLEEVGWYDSNSNHSSHLVMSLRPNEIGLYDMSGLVWEWCQDWHSLYSINSLTNPSGPEEGDKKVIKGGCFFSTENMCHPGFHCCESPYSQKHTIGFRMILDFEKLL